MARLLEVDKGRQHERRKKERKKERFPTREGQGQIVNVSYRHTTRKGGWREKEPTEKRKV